MSIGIKDKYVFQFSIAGKNDFINRDDLIKFSLACDVGNVLPEFELEFLTTDDTMLETLNEGNELQISFGQSRLNMKNISLKVIYAVERPSGDNHKNIYCNGYLNFPKYFDSGVSISDKLSAVEVMVSIARQQGFRIDTNIQSSEDAMYWVQDGCSYRRYINHLWLHSWITNSFLSLGVDIDGSFIIRDIKQVVDQPFKWKLTKNPQTAKDIAIDADPVIAARSGFINSWFGYQREQTITNWETGDSQIIKPKNFPLMAETSQLMRNAEVQRRIFTNGFKNSNVHDKFSEAYLKNLSSLVLFSTVEVNVSFHDAFTPIRLLDLVTYKPTSTNSQFSSRTNSGLYLVTGITRNLSADSLTTVLTLHRESFNKIRGNFQ